MNILHAPCWADPLDRDELLRLGRRLARACQRFYDQRDARLSRLYTIADVRVVRDRIEASAEMAELHLDVTERAAAWSGAHVRGVSP